MSSLIKFKVMGNSMYPLFLEGDLVFISNKRKFKSGDIILFIDTKGSKIIHRVIRLGKKTFTMGDNNSGFDYYPIKRIIGVAKIKENYFRKIYFTFRLFLKALFGQRKVLEIEK